jgi:hypothetical protein
MMILHRMNIQFVSSKKTGCDWSTVETIMYLKHTSCLSKLIKELFFDNIQFAQTIVCKLEHISCIVLSSFW